MNSGSPRKQRLVQFVYEVWNCGREEVVGDYLATSYTLHHDPGDPWHGQVLDIEGYKARVRASRAPFPDQQFDIQHLCVDGDAVVMTWLWKACHLGGFAGFLATGEIIRMSGMTVYMFDAADKLSGHWQMTDRLGVFQQLQKNKTRAE
ncbi:MAG: ester cyclase [Janthinobacterium lividum]